MLKNRFLSVFALAFAAGIAMPILLGTGKEAVSFLICACLAALFVGVFVRAHYRSPDLKKILLYPLIFALGMCFGAGWLYVRSLPYASYESFSGVKDTVEGIVTESGASSESGYIELQIDRSKAVLPKGTRVRLYFEDERLIRIGDRVGAVLTYGNLSYDSQRANRVALTANGAVISAEDGEGVVSFVRYWILDACLELFDPYGVAGTAQALIVRERTLMSEAVSEAYRNAGLSHLIAISGLHLTVLIAALRRILLSVGMRKRTRELLALLLIIFYCFLAGFSPSIMRAAIMTGAVLIGEITFSECDRLTVLFLALLILLIANPYALLSLGLQLSFLSCLGIVLLEPYVTALQRKISGRKNMRHYRLRKSASGIVGSFMVSCSAVVFTFPVTVFNFGTVAYLAPFANLVFVPLFSPVLSLALLSVIVYPFFPPVAEVIAFLPGQILRLTEHFLAFLPEHGIGSFETDSAWMLLPALLAVAAILCVLLFMKHGFRLYLSFSVAFALTLTICVIALPSGSEHSYLAVSSAEGYVFSSDGKTGTFLDLGSENAAFTLSEGDIHTYIVTAVDDVSLARMEFALKNGTVETVYLPISSITGTKNDLSSHKALANEKNCDIIEYHYTVETETLLFTARNGRAETPFGITVLLYGEAPAPSDGLLVLLPSYRGDLPSIPTEQLFFPLGYEAQLPDSDVHLYRDIFLYQNGKVEKP